MTVTTSGPVNGPGKNQPEPGKHPDEQEDHRRRIASRRHTGPRRIPGPPRIPRQGRRRRGRCRADHGVRGGRWRGNAGRRPGRADPSQRDVEAGLQLPAWPGRDLRVGRDARGAHRLADRGPFPDPRVPRGRARAGVAGHGRRAAGHRAGRPEHQLLLHGQEPGPGLRRRSALRHDRAPTGRMAERGGRPRSDPQRLRGLRHHLLPGREHGRTDGRVVPPRGELGGRPARPQDAHSGAGRRRHGPHGRDRPGPGRGRHLPRAGAGRDRRHRMGRTLRRREARPPQGRALLLLPGLVGAVGVRVVRGQSAGVGHPFHGVQGRLRGRSAGVGAQDALLLRRQEPGCAGASHRRGDPDALLFERHHDARAHDDRRNPGGVLGGGPAVPGRLRPLAQLQGGVLPLVRHQRAEVRELRVRGSAAATSSAETTLSSPAPSPATATE